MNVNQFLDYTKDLYLSYSMHVIGGRSISFTQDGLKPVHRRTLYAMHALNLTATSEHKKSARIVGDTIGKYHPHGDKSVYDALVLMAQPWKMRYPLIDGQGNFGSRDGDNAAAMRYTESRLAPLGEIVVKELNTGSVDFKLNFDATLEEPMFLPAPLPIQLLNGSDGIAVGYRADMPSHNIQEVVDATIATIRKPSITIPEIMEIIQGPDLPVGAQITSSKKDILKAYETGKGNLKARCRWEVIEKKRNQWEIVINEFPIGTCAAEVLLVINEAMKQDPKNDNNNAASKKKAKLRTFVKGYVDKVDDITDSILAKKGGSALKIEPKKCTMTPDEFMAHIVTLLELEKTYIINLFAISVDGLPKMRNIKELIEGWVDFRRYTVTKRLNSRLAKVISRLEILDGRLSIMDCMDKVIEIIRESEDPVIELQSEFGLTERQALDIMEIKLRELRRLESDKLEQEKNKLEEEKLEIEETLASQKKLDSLIIKDMKLHTKKLVDVRKTLIEESKPLQPKSLATAAAEAITVYVSRNNWVVSRKKGTEPPVQLLQNDDEFTTVIETSSSSSIIGLSEVGRAITIPCKLIPNGRTMSHVNSLVQTSGENVVAYVGLDEDANYFLAQNQGYGFVVEGKNLLSRQKAGKELFKLTDGAKIITFEKLNSPKFICMSTNKGRLLRYDFSELESFVYPKGKGVRLISIKEEVLTGLSLHAEDEFILDGQVVQVSDPLRFHKKRAAAPAKM